MRWRDEQPQRLPRAEAGDLCGHDHHAHPKLRTGSFFPDDIVERYQRVDRAFVAAMAVMCDEDEEWSRARYFSEAKMA